MGLTWSTIPNICGLPLRVGTLWIAEIFTMLSLLSVWNAAIMIYQPPSAIYCLSVPLKSLLLSLLQAGCSVSLAAGAYKNAPSLVLPWLLLNATLMVLIALGFAIFFFIFLKFLMENPKLLVMILYSLVMYFVPMRFLITGVYSYYKELKKQNSHGDKHVLIGDSLTDV